MAAVEGAPRSAVSSTMRCLVQRARDVGCRRRARRRSPASAVRRRGRAGCAVGRRGRRNEGERVAIIVDRDRRGLRRPSGSAVPAAGQKTPARPPPMSSERREARGRPARVGSTSAVGSATGSGVGVGRRRRRSSRGRCRPRATVGASGRRQPGLQLRGDVRVAELQGEPRVRQRLEPARATRAALAGADVPSTRIAAGIAGSTARIAAVPSTASSWFVSDPVGRGQLGELVAVSSPSAVASAVIGTIDADADLGARRRAARSSRSWTSTGPSAASYDAVERIHAGRAACEDRIVGRDHDAVDLLGDPAAPPRVRSTRRGVAGTPAVSPREPGGERRAIGQRRAPERQRHRDGRDRGRPSPFCSVTDTLSRSPGRTMPLADRREREAVTVGPGGLDRSRLRRGERAAALAATAAPRRRRTPATRPRPRDGRDRDHRGARARTRATARGSSGGVTVMLWVSLLCDVRTARSSAILRSDASESPCRAAR